MSSVDYPAIQEPSPSEPKTPVGFHINRPSLAGLAQLSATLLYAAAIHYSHRIYLNSLWGYFGFSYKQPRPEEWLLMGLLLLAGTVLLPSRLSGPAALVAIVLFTVVYVPTVVLTLALDADVIGQYGWNLVALAGAMAMVGAAAQQHGQSIEVEDSFSPSIGIATFLLIAWYITCVYLLLRFGNVMRFAGFADIYEQRSAGASTGLIESYIQTYFSSVLSPGLIAFGLTWKRWAWVVIGVSGCFIMYLINAQRMVLLLPIVLFAGHGAMSAKADWCRSVPVMLVALSSVVAISSEYYLESVVAFGMAGLLVFRTLGIPGLSFSQYQDVFGGGGYTLWSHVKGLSLVVQAPTQFAGDPSWPGLGYIVGDRIYGNSEINVNANLFSGDGVAALGALGVFAIGLALSIWLVVLGRVSSRWPWPLATLITLPVALALTNGHFFTVLLSFGGLFWLCVFFFARSTPAGDAKMGPSSGEAPLVNTL
jgi:hypothetical protein